jgi:hypothetical protein
MPKAKYAAPIATIAMTIQMTGFMLPALDVAVAALGVSRRSDSVCAALGFGMPGSEP